MKEKIALGIVTAIAATTFVLCGRAALREKTHHDKYEEQHERFADDCTRWKTTRGGGDDAVGCQRGQGPKKLAWKEPLAKVAAARAKLDSGDKAGAVFDLRAAVDGARELDRTGTPMAEIFSAKILGEVLDVIEASSSSSSSSSSLSSSHMPNEKRARLDHASVASILAGPPLRATLHPLEGERLYTLSAISSAASERSLPVRLSNRWGALTVLAADAMSEETTITLAMESAIRRGDTQSCIREGNERNLTKHYGIGAEALCPRLVSVVQTNKRLERVRSRF